MDHAKVAAEHLQAAARDVTAENADVLAMIGCGHALLAVSGQLNAIARAAAAAPVPTEDPRRCALT